MASNYGGLSSGSIKYRTANNSVLPVAQGPQVAARPLQMYVHPCHPKLFSLSAFLFGLMAHGANALPQGGQVVAGEAELTEIPNELTINQTTDRAVINYQSFNVEVDERVQFIQPSEQSVTLNRVVGNDLANIAGQIDANGQIVLLNPNGVVFHEGAQVDVGGLVVSTLDAADQSFMQGRLELNGTGGEVINRGVIGASGGVYLVAPELVNEGQIDASKVAMISGRSVLVEAEGSSIPVLLEDPTADTAGHIVQAGEINAQQVLLSMQGGAGSEIRNDGLIRAAQVAGNNGTIELVAPGADVLNTGELIAAGGEVNIQSDRYAQTGVINTSSDQGGGDVNILTTQSIALHSSALIEASGQVDSSAGDVILIADVATAFVEGAQINAQGGSLGGDGGFVEVSGKENVLINGLVNVGAVAGSAGTFYIDPSNVTINDNGVNESAFIGTGPYTWDFGGAQDAQIDIDTILAALMNGDVIINTASPAAFPGDMSIEVDIDIHGIPNGRTMTLIADGNITFLNSVDILDTQGESSDVNLVMTAGGNVDFGSGNTVFSGEGTITVNAGGNVTVTELQSDSTSDSAISINAGGAILDDTDDNTGLTASSGGVFLAGANGISTNNDIALNTSRLGVSLGGANDYTISPSGNITLTGINLSGSADFTVNAGGNINYTGTLGGELDGSTGAINLNSTSGNVILTGILSDTVGAIDNSTDLNITSNSGVFMSNDAVIHLGSGIANVSTTSGGASFTGLTSLSTASNAITLNINSGNLSNPGDVSPVDLAAPNGGVVLNVLDGAYGITIDTQTLDVVSGGGSVSIIAPNDLELTNVDIISSAEFIVAGDLSVANPTTLNAQTFTFNSGQTLTLPDAGLSAGNAINLTSNEMVTASSGRTFALTAPNINLSTAAAGGDIVVNSTADNIALTNTGVNTIDVTDADDVTLTDVNFPSGTISLTTLTGFDLSLNGSIELDGDNGTLALNSGTDLTIDANILDTVGTVDNSSTIVLNAFGDVLFETSAQIDVGAGLLTVVAGGDVEAANLRANTLNVIAGGEIQDVNGDTINFTAVDAGFTAGAGIGQFDTLETAITNATLNSGGGSALLSNTGDLTLSTIDVIGDLNVAVDTGDLTIVEQTPAITGNTNLQITSGGLILNALELNLSGDLTLSTDNITDLGPEFGASIYAQNADITLTGTEAVYLTGDFTNLVLNVINDQQFTFIDYFNGLLVSDVSSQGVLSLATNNNQNLVLRDDTPTFGNDLYLSAVGAEVDVPADWLTVAGDLYVTANALVDADADGIVTLVADSATLTLNQTADAAYHTMLTDFTLNSTGTGALGINALTDVNLVELSNGGDVNIYSNPAGSNVTISDALIEVPGLTTITLTGSQLQVGAAGLNTTGDLVVDAADIFTGNTQVNIGAVNADITLSAPTVSQWNTAVGTLSLDLNTAQDITVVDAGALTLAGLTTNGSASITATDDNLVVLNNPSVGGDLSLIATQTGDIELPATGLVQNGNVLIDALNILSSQTMVTLSADTADITLRQADSDLTWTTTLNALALNHTGPGSFTLNNSQNLAVNGLSAGGDATISAVGDLTLNQSTSNVVGGLNLTATGNLVLPAAGFTAANVLNINAADITDGDNNITLAATAANINLTANNSDAVWQSAFDNLIINSAGAGALTLNNDRALILGSVQTASDLTLNTAGDLTFNEAAPNIGGDLNIATSANGIVRVNDAGLTVANDLTIAADALVDSDNQVSLTAANANIQLRDLTAATTLDTQFASAVWDLLGAAVTVNQTGATTLAGLTASHDFILNATDTLTVTAGTFTTSATVDLNSGAANTVINNTGLSTSGALNIQAADLVDGDGGAVSLSATDANLQLANATSINLNTNVNTLGLNAANALNVIVNDSGDLILNEWSVPAVDNIALIIAGELTTLPTGLQANQSVVVTATDLTDGDRSVDLAANTVQVALSAPVGDVTLNTEAQNLDVNLGGQADLNINQTGDLTLVNTDASNGALNVNNGSINVRVQDGDLLVEGDIGAADLTVDGTRSGIIDLGVTNGNLTIGGSNDVAITSSNNVDQAPSGDLAPGVIIQVLGTEVDDRAVTLGNGSNTVAIVAEGADISINARADGTAETSARTIVQNSGATLTSYNNIADEPTGTVTINGIDVAAGEGQTLGEGRRLVWVSDYEFPQPPANDDYTEEVIEIDEVQDPVASDDSPRDQVDVQFVKAFGECNEADENERSRCRIQTALKSFLSHWLVGGELPPKTEI